MDDVEKFGFFVYKTKKPQLKLSKFICLLFLIFLIISFYSDHFIDNLILLYICNKIISFII